MPDPKTRFTDSPATPTTTIAPNIRSQISILARSASSSGSSTDDPAVYAALLIVVVGILTFVSNMTRGILPFPFPPEHPMIGFRDDGLESSRSKFRNMTEAELVQCGKTLRDKWDKSLNADQKKNLVELKEARAEWTRRHPKLRTSSKRI
jgi:hypothetical protein